MKSMKTSREKRRFQLGQPKTKPIRVGTAIANAGDAVRATPYMKDWGFKKAKRVHRITPKNGRTRQIGRLIARRPSNTMSRMEVAPPPLTGYGRNAALIRDFDRPDGGGRSISFLKYREQRPSKRSKDIQGSQAFVKDA